ncbi:MAG: N-acetylmuramoyl-L-alanine amidase [Clostridium sp.]|uniref:N-acetylmuramoyl-L-alanine amidase AmiC n=1 Tax=Clostridium paraputrificum TaxID=29363 RepID=A0A6N3GH93_9CLOT|nr:N-acetylmuramoyl-L-alanine amidase [Clostridium sp.]MBS5928114.1 N-acetylmuramoyl-L-alanine amidase [Clostridium sp.]
MKVRGIIVAVFIALLIIKVPVMAEEISKGIVLIDAGHGGIDGGAQSKNGTIEKDINLQISKRLKEKLEKEGYKVYMTREEDKELSPKKVKDLEARCKMKIETKCDVFISIHQNKFNSEKCFGAQVWYASNEKSMKLAKYVQDSLKERVKDNNKRLEKPAKEQYKILRDKYDGACLIVECGFLSNNEEEQRLKSESHQNQIVDGITIGINKYFDEIK